MAGFEAEAKIFIEAGPEKVWRALVDPALIKRYLFGTEVVTDWKVGSPIVYRGVWQGKAYEDKGSILEVLPGKRLVSTFWSSLGGKADRPENYNRVAYELEPSSQGGAAGTSLRITQDNNTTEEEARHSSSNWAMVLQGLKDLVEKGAE